MANLQGALENRRIALEQVKERVQHFRGPCVECRWYRQVSGYACRTRYCAHPLLEQLVLSPVDGLQTIPSKVECSDARAEKGHCGPDGLLFEQATLANIMLRRDLITFVVLLVWALAAAFTIMLHHHG